MSAGRGADLSAHIEAVEAENERLRDRVQELETAHGMDFVAPVAWRLTISEAAVFGSLLARDLCTKQVLFAATKRGFGEDEREIKIVDVFVCKLRKKLQPFGVIIETRWGLGYTLNAQSRSLVRAFIAEQPA